MSIASTKWYSVDRSAPHYTAVLSHFHKCLKPKTYFEIGTNTGTSLVLASCPSVAVDPVFLCNQNVLGTKPSLHMFQMTSDAFFKAHNVREILGGPVELAFLDGLHQFEFLLRDFIETEKACRRNSVILLHDCLPADAFVARREQHDQRGAEHSPYQGWWAGDVWKTVAILQKFRPDLHVTMIDTPPTGLALITNLDPDATVLAQRYFDIVRSCREGSPEEPSFEAMMAKLTMVPVSSIDSPAKLAQFCWL